MRFIPLALLLAVSAAAAGTPAFDADFRRDPARQGFVPQGDAESRFAWLRARHLAVTLDSNAPAARLVSPLGMSLDGTTSFRLEADFVIEGLDASPDDFFQLGFGLVNLGTTGLNRTGTSLPVPPFFVDDSDVFDSVGFDYYPNVTFFGGPFLQPTVFGAESGSAFANFAANFGPSSDLGDNGPGQVTELPQGRPLRVVMFHDACSQRLVTRLFDLGGHDPAELDTGIAPLDLSVLNATGTFTVDAFGIHAYQDLADFDPSTPSLLGEMEILRVSVEPVALPEARLLPRALEEQPRSPARIRVRGALPGASLVLVESGGVPVGLELDGRVAGPHVFAEIPRELAVPPMLLRVGDCLVTVDAGSAP